MRGSWLFGVGIVLLAFLVLAYYLFATDERSREFFAEGAKQDEPIGLPEIPADPGSAATATAAQETAGQASESSIKTDPAPPVGFQFGSWPKPDFAFVVTGEMNGYFEPCGCTASQLGGMNRRGDLLRQIDDLGWTVRGIDVGRIPRRTGRQAQVKFETTLAAMRDLKYLATGIGPEELRLDPGFLISQHVVDGDQPLHFLSANLVFYGVADLGTPRPFRIADVNGHKVGVTSVMTDRVRKEAIPDRNDESAADITWSDPAEALTKVLAEFEKEQVEFRILLSQGFEDESTELAKAFPAFDMVITTRGHGEGDPDPEMIGDTNLLRVGSQGKHAGVVGVYSKPGRSTVRYELVTLDGESFGDSPAMIQHMKNYQERLREEQIAMSDSEVTHPSGSTFLGAAKCGECHTKAFEIWQKTPHAHAFESLDPVNQRKGHERLNGVARSFDAECLSCHVTGWDPKEYVRFRSGFVNTEFAPDEDSKLLQSLLAGNQCENCHGPGSRHVELVEAGNTDAAAKEMRVSLETAEKVTCVSCHDVDNSPKFDFKTYWDEVKHYGKD